MARNDRPAGSVTLVGVAKRQPLELVAETIRAGLADVAENYLQEAQAAFAELPPVRRHFIGHLQTNKAKAVAELFDVVQSVDSLRLAEALSSAAVSLAKTLDVYAQVNISLEPQKHGFGVLGGEEELARLAGLPGLKLKGLMGMAAAVDDPAAARPDFARLRELRQRLQPSLGPLLLSMGMSHDFEVAIEEGADLVRVGSALFKA